MEPVTVDILLATYNGEKYLPVQLDSLVSQSYTNWKLYIRDDGSKDNTPKLLDEFAQKHPGKVEVIKDGKGNVGPRENFSVLMQHSQSDYILFCDQDDQWLPQKVEKTLQKMQSLENGHKDIPCYVFTDLRMVDEDLNVLAESIWEKDKLNPAYTSLNRLLMQNVPYGCASMINRSLLKLADPIDQRAFLQDYWCVLLASAAGKIDYLPEATINHCVHGNNASRGADPLKKEIKDDLQSKLTNKNLHLYFAKLQEQAVAVKERLTTKGIRNKQLDVLEDFINLPKMNPISRKFTMLSRGFYKNQFLLTLKWIIRL